MSIRNITLDRHLSLNGYYNYNEPLSCVKRLITAIISIDSCNLYDTCYNAMKTIMGLFWFLSWLLAYPLFRVFFGVEIQGRIPRKGAYIIACNHQSFLDPPIVGVCAFREIHFLAKTGLFGMSGWFRRLIESFNAVPISGTRGLRTAIRLLERGQVVTIFPEGTRSRNGAMLPFNPGVGYLAVNYQIPVIPVCIRNSNQPWWLIALRWYRLRIKYGDIIHPDGYAKTPAGYQRFSDRLREEILKLQ